MTHVLYTPKGIQALDTIKAVNEMAAMPSHLTPSTRSGNYRAEIYPKAPGADAEAIMRGSVHGCFRDMIGELTKLLDKKSLPDAVHEKEKELTKQMDRYGQETGKIKAMFDTLYAHVPKKEQPRYSSIEGLVNRLYESPDYKGDLFTEASVSRLRIEGIDNDAAEAIFKLDRALEKVETFSLINGAVVPNTKFLNSSAAEWLFYADYATRAVFDTTINPAPLKEKLKDTVGIFQSITVRAVTMVEKIPELQCDAVYGVFEKTAERLQNQTARSGSFDELAAADHGKILPMLGIKSAADHQAVLDRIKENAALAGNQLKKPHPKPVYSRCPFGHGQE